MGFITKDKDLALIYSAADILIVPSRIWNHLGKLQVNQWLALYQLLDLILQELKI